MPRSRRSPARRGSKRRSAGRRTSGKFGAKPIKNTFLSGGGGMGLMSYGCKAPRSKVCRSGSWPNYKVVCKKQGARCPAGFSSP